MSNSFFLPAASISHTGTLNAEHGQLSIAAARMTADLRAQASSVLVSFAYADRVYPRGRASSYCGAGFVRSGRPRWPDRPDWGG